MPRLGRGADPSPASRPPLEIAEIFRLHGAAYRKHHFLTVEQKAVMHAIETCRTPALGGHLDVCDTCGYARPAYNSCRNRHCPKCQSLTQAKWIEQRMTRILPTHYFHVVFTLPALLRPLAIRNRRKVFALLFQAASQTLLALGRDPARLGAELGITAVLHTWTRDLQFHPHLHCIVTGGGLSIEGERWVKAPRRYLFPVKVLSRLFRGKFLAALRRAYHQHELELSGVAADLSHPAIFRCLLDELYRKQWVVYAKRPFGGPDQVFNYLGRYTHRVAISNHRLQAIDSDTVRFATKHGSAVTLSPQEFIRRFLLHVLPTGFVKIRHFGLFAASKATTALNIARGLLERALTVEQSQPLPTDNTELRDWKAHFKQLTGIDLSRCPLCPTGTMISHPLSSIARRPPYRAPPELNAA